MQGEFYKIFMKLSQECYKVTLGDKRQGVVTKTHCVCVRVCVYQYIGVCFCFKAICSAISREKVDDRVPMNASECVNMCISCIAIAPTCLPKICELVSSYACEGSGQYHSYRNFMMLATLALYSLLPCSVDRRFPIIDMIVEFSYAVV